MAATTTPEWWPAFSGEIRRAIPKLQCAREEDLVALILPHAPNRSAAVRFVERNRAAIGAYGIAFGAATRTRGPAPAQTERMAGAVAKHRSDE